LLRGRDVIAAVVVADGPVGALDVCFGAVEVALRQLGVIWHAFHRGCRRIQSSHAILPATMMLQTGRIKSEAIDALPTAGGSITRFQPPAPVGKSTPRSPRWIHASSSPGRRRHYLTQRGTNFWTALLS
jgi:hypothetical protein